jgi:Lon protease-like protein
MRPRRTGQAAGPSRVPGRIRPAARCTTVPWWGMPGTRLPMFPLSAVLFPHATMPLHVFEPLYRELMRDCLAGDARFGVVLIARGSEVGGGDERSRYATRGVITEAAELADGRWVLEIEGEALIEVEEWLPDDPYPVALVRAVAPEAGTGRGDAAAAPLVGAAGQRVRRARALLAEQGGAPPLAPELPLDGGGDVDLAAWQLCAVAPVSAYDAQRLLVAEGAAVRLRLLAELMDELELDLHRMLRAE